MNTIFCSSVSCRIGRGGKRGKGWTLEWIMPFSPRLVLAFMPHSLFFLSFVQSDLDSMNRELIESKTRALQENIQVQSSSPGEQDTDLTIDQQQHKETLASECEQLRAKLQESVAQKDMALDQVQQLKETMTARVEEAKAQIRTEVQVVSAGTA